MRISVLVLGYRKARWAPVHRILWLRVECLLLWVLMIAVGLNTLDLGVDQHNSHRQYDCCWSGSRVPRRRLSPSVGRWSSPTAVQFQWHAEAANAANTLNNSVMGVSRPLVLDYGTTFHPDYGGRDLPSTPSDNLWKIIYLATEALSDSFECIGAI